MSNATEALSRDEIDLRLTIDSELGDLYEYLKDLLIKVHDTRS